jgi:hypothetical protein
MAHYQWLSETNIAPGAAADPFLDLRAGWRDHRSPPVSMAKFILVAFHWKTLLSAGASFCRRSFRSTLPTKGDS